MPEAPVSVNVTALSSTHLMVNFDPPERSDLVTQYTIYLNRSECEPGEVSYETAGLELSLEVGPICPYEEVRVQVSATTAGGEGPRSDEEQGRTQEGRKNIYVFAENRVDVHYNSVYASSIERYKKHISITLCLLMFGACYRCDVCLVQSYS